MSEAPQDEQIHPVSRRLGFIEGPRFGRRLMMLLAAVFLALAATDIAHHRHALFAWEGVWGFHVWFGFAAFTVVVLMGWPLHSLLSRPENYYGDGEGDD